MTIGILPFTYVSGSASFGDVNTISENVVTAFTKTRRFNIVDRSKIDAINAEKKLQKSEDFIDGTVAEQGKSMGAEFLVSGHVSSASKSSEQKSRTKKDGTTEYYMVHEAKINFTCKVIDVATGQVVNTETFSNSNGGFLGIDLNSNSADDAFNSSMKNLTKSIDKWVSLNFPLVFPIVEVQKKDKKGLPVEILVGAGSDSGVEKGDKLVVVEVSVVEVNGAKKERRKEIGSAKVSKVEDGSFSICTISDGADVIQQKLDAGAKIMLKTVK
jgi:hypothetical protein